MVARRRPDLDLRPIHDGVPARDCLAWGNVLTETQSVAAIAYSHTIRGSEPLNARDPQGEPYDSPQTFGE